MPAERELNVKLNKQGCLLIVSVIVAAAGLFAACDGDDGDGVTGTGTATPTQTRTATATTPGATAAPGDDEETPGSQATRSPDDDDDDETPLPTDITISMIATTKFDLNVLMIAPKTDVKITAKNTEDGVEHNFAIYEFAGGGPTGASLFATEICKGACEKTITVNLEEDQYWFQCTIHPDQMKGLLLAEED